MARGSYDDDYYPEEPRRSAPRPQPHPPPLRTKEMIRPKVAGVLVLVGIMIFFIGAILVQSSVLVEHPDWDDYEDDPEDYEDAEEEYEDTIRGLIGGGRILNWIGTMMIVFPLYIIGVSSEKLDWKVRASMLGSATALIIATMVVTMFIAPFGAV
ncbi:MAG: hypothetical protein KAJ51_11115 [Thermoplasmata archaeon]|nr:hypothetical protein [Thermoplasmata archaeon]